MAPRNCQLTFLPPCKKTRSYVPVYVATAHEPHDELARQGSRDPGRGARRGTRLGTTRLSMQREREREKDTFRYDYGIANRSKRLLTTYEFALQYEKSIVFRGNGETLWELYENFARSSYFQ